ncbi:hypothetical protein DV096_17750 [Bradymonadaceae bacterium TMQ3]|uniref:Transmembrane protein n=1 Tax=Lujinxingia sediminis TaxID=2480984 RepID=A0ABY0CVC2_9DELT|nr:hypothetical protein [Lujinxingia sediminis]RDV36594.1 hypothetical protein DV096_17750 [Bradymonadaceae bacterium TMQ3]RVU47013.1 hypothetical protein EA187_07735 [Lujinxingia sediminis]TXC68624.1 hypothetical protein FRC91_18810 [Bradymonadales bacterium TMQ1]
MSEELKRFDHVMRWRVRLSAVGYALFVAVGVAGSWAGWLQENPTPAVVLLVGSFLAWPQRALPRYYKIDDEVAGAVQLREERAQRDRRLRAVRGLYFLGAVVVLLVVPWAMGSSPV